LSTTRLRVVQWATGNIGLRALREAIRHPALELVGVLCTTRRARLDAGTLCGEDPVGADCVLYMPRSLDLDDVVELLDPGRTSSRLGASCSRGRRLGD